MKNILPLILISCFFFSQLNFSQEDLLSEIDFQDSTKIEKVNSVFKSLRIVNFQSTKLVSKKELTLDVSHRFGNIRSGMDEFFGLDNAVTRIELIYGISDFLNVSFSRSSYRKVYELSFKYKLLSQSNKSPISVLIFNSLTYDSSLDNIIYPGLKSSHRYNYANQILISRKFNDKFSFEISPTIFHENLVNNEQQDNTQYAIVFGERFKISKRVSLNMDYGLHLNRYSNDNYRNPLSIGIDLETGGHVFQLMFTNSQAMNTNYLLSSSSGNWKTGDLFFGFNLVRRF